MQENERKVAQLHCNGTSQNCAIKYEYKGVKTCRAAALLQGGYKNCSYACLSYGDCVEVCQFDALSMQPNGLPLVDKDKCTACGLCVKICPKQLYTLVPYKNKVHVLCNSKDPGKVVVKVCKVGCTACKACEKACKFDAIHVIGNIARIDYSKCTQCGACVTACPRKIILDERKAS